MFTRSRLQSFVVALLLVATSGLLAQQGADTGSRDHRVAFFGSSVPNGTGDETGQGGYTSLEIYAPLRGVGDAVAMNLAQSLSVVEVDTAGVTHSQD